MGWLSLHRPEHASRRRSNVKGVVRDAIYEAHVGGQLVAGSPSGQDKTPAMFQPADIADPHTLTVSQVPWVNCAYDRDLTACPLRVGGGAFSRAIILRAAAFKKARRASAAGRVRRFWASCVKLLAPQEGYAQEVERIVRNRSRRN